MRILLPEGIYPRFYKVTDPVVGNLATVCILVDKEEEKIVARGITIRSPKDQDNKKRGKNKAFGMAMAAFKNQTSDPKYKINRNVDGVMKMGKKPDGEDRLIPLNYCITMTKMLFDTKSYYMPEMISETEVNLLQSVIDGKKKDKQ